MSEIPIPPHTFKLNRNVLLMEKMGHGLRYLWLCSPILIALLVMLPRLLAPQFGMLDDGITLLVAEKVKEDWHVAFRFTHELEHYFLVNQGGRFFPAFWLFFSGLYAVIGPNSFLAFGANYLVLASLTAGLMGLVRLRGGSNLQAWAAGLFFVLSGPVIENFYTMSKAEPPQLLWIMISLLLILFYPRIRNKWQKVGVVVAAALAVLLAALTKETTVVLVPISLGWIALGWLKFKAEPVQNLPTRWIYFIITLGAGIIAFSLRWYYLPISFAQGAHTGFYRLEWQSILASASRWTAWIMRDFFYLIPLVIFIITVTFLRKQALSRLALEAVIWMLGWVAIFLPWYSLQEYYLLPFALGCAVFSGVAVEQVLAWVRSAGPKALRLLAGSCLILSLGILPITIVNNWTNARIQLAVDGANADFLNFLATLPPNSQILMNLASINEYVIKTEPLLAATRNRSDIGIDYFKYQVASPTEPQQQYYVATPTMTNQTQPTVRIAVYEAGAMQWNKSLQNFLNRQPDLVYQTERRVKLFDIGLHRLMCPLFRRMSLDGLLCSIGRPLIDTRTFTYGWEIYQVSSQVEALALPAVFLPEGTWQLQRPDGSIAQLQFGQPGDVPVAGDWDGDGFDEIGLFRPANLTWYLDNDLDGQADLEFQFSGMEPTDIPLSGDWDGDGKSTPGYFRPDDSSWHFRNNNTTGAEDLAIIQLGSSTDVPISGDWDGDGQDTIGLYRPSDGSVELWNSPADRTEFSTQPQASPAVADWAGHGLDSVAIVAGKQWYRQFVNCSCQVSNNGVSIEFGSPAGIPLAGRWDTHF